MLRSARGLNRTGRGSPTKTTSASTVATEMPASSTWWMNCVRTHMDGPQYDALTDPSCRQMPPPGHSLAGSPTLYQCRPGARGRALSGDHQQQTAGNALVQATLHAPCTFRSLCSSNIRTWFIVSLHSCVDVPLLCVKRSSYMPGVKSYGQHWFCQFLAIYHCLAIHHPPESLWHPSQSCISAVKSTMAITQQGWIQDGGSSPPVRSKVVISTKLTGLCISQFPYRRLLRSSTSHGPRHPLQHPPPPPPRAPPRPPSLTN